MKADVLDTIAVVPTRGAAMQLIPCFGRGDHSHPVAALESDPLSHPAVPPNLSHKIDRFSALALIAISKLLPSLPANYDPASVGVFVGNMLGGWAYGEKQLNNLIETGPRSVRPNLATAFLPVAAQGEVSIRFGLTGFSKTVSGGCLCGVEALMIGLDALAKGEVKYAIAGAAESPVSSFGLWGLAGGCPTNDLCYGEGSAFMLLANEARDTNARIETKPLGFEPTDGNWYTSEVDGARLPGTRPVRIPGVDPVLDVLELLPTVKSSASVRISQRAATGQGFTTVLYRPNQTI